MNIRIPNAKQTHQLPTQTSMVSCLPFQKADNIIQESGIQDAFSMQTKYSNVEAESTRKSGHYCKV
jgi:hypothetical protein